MPVLWHDPQKGDIVIAAKLDRLFRSALDAIREMVAMKAGASLRVVAAEDQPHGAYEGPEEGVMSYSTKLVWLGGPDHGWWVELLKDGERVAYMSLDEWGSLDATQQAIEDAIADRAAAKANRAADV